MSQKTNEIVAMIYAIMIACEPNDEMRSKNKWVVCETRSKLMNSESPSFISEAQLRHPRVSLYMYE